MNLNLDEQRRLAELVTGRKAKVDDGQVYFEYPEWECGWKTWKPSVDMVDGAECHLAQACRVIVAAFGIPGFCALYKMKDETLRIEVQQDLTWFTYGPDILEAASRALLAAKGDL